MTMVHLYGVKDRDLQRAEDERNEWNAASYDVLTGTYKPEHIVVEIFDHPAAIIADVREGLFVSRQVVAGYVVGGPEDEVMTWLAEKGYTDYEAR